MVAFLSLFVDAIINGIDIPNVELYILVLKCTATNKIKVGNCKNADQEREVTTSLSLHLWCSLLFRTHSRKATLFFKKWGMLSDRMNDREQSWI